MTRPVPSISIEQVRAFVELADTGQIKLAAVALHVSEEGVRNRLIMLEERLGVSLYEKQRGRRSDVTLTHAGQMFLGKAIQFLEKSQRLTRTFDPDQRSSDILIASSQYLTDYLLVDLLREFRAQHSHLTVRLLTRVEREVLSSLESDPNLALGICAPLDYPKNLICRPWFAMEWYFVATLGHPLLRNPSINLSDLVDEPMILFEAGSTGRQHILEAFYQRGLSPRIAMEATTTQTILRMAEAGLGAAIVPLLPSGVVTRSIAVGRIPLHDQIRPIESCILFRPERLQDAATQRFVEYALGTPALRQPR